MPLSLVSNRNLFLIGVVGSILISSLLWELNPFVQAVPVGNNPRPAVTPSPTPVIESSPENAEIELDLKPFPDPFESPRELQITDILDMAFGTPDVDCDGVQNREDNCPIAYNPNQKDKDNDQEGDVCDKDTGGNPEKKDWRCDRDGDGLLDRRDNCILVCNPKQQDRDKDGVGDACDVKDKPNFRRIDPCSRRAKTDDRKFGGY